MGGLLLAIPLQAAVIKLALPPHIRPDQKSWHREQNRLRAECNFLHAEKLLLMFGKLDAWIKVPDLPPAVHWFVKFIGNMGKCQIQNVISSKVLGLPGLRL